ncbi:MAG TPA: glucose-6-phosphate isomerase [Abditibacteriaceae bacterium]|jgi:glucose-6-phosphate isomerase
MNDLWERYARYLNWNAKMEFSLDISRMNFPDEYLGNLESRLQKSYSAMAELEQGAIANPDENRKVGHYWLRAPHLAPDGLGDEIEDVLNDIKNFVSQVHSGDISPERGGNFQNILIIGIGGSALGPQFVANALSNENDVMTPYFFDNTDPDGMARTLQRIGDLSKTLTIVISKSGGTPETRNGMLEAQSAYHEAGLHFGRHAVAVTGVGSKLDEVAENERWLARFPMWDWVGGRTSELSAVGLLPAALQGFDIDAMLRGAREMDDCTRTRTTLENPSALLAAMWYFATDGKGAKDMVILPYKDRLELFARYLQQLVMESLGKEKDLDGVVVHQGIAVYGNKGSTDQHAYVQQLREGVPNFFATFIEVLQDSGSGLNVDGGATSGDFLSGFLHGSRAALYENGRGSITITVQRVDAQTVGRLIALYERAVGLYGFLVNVNAYHQPGVEAGKKAAQTILDLQKRVLEVMRSQPGAALSADEIAGHMGAPNEAENVFHIARHLAANGRLAQSGPASPRETMFSSK